MKKVLLFITGFLGLLSPDLIKAQTATFTVPLDTVYASYGVSAPTDDITNITPPSGGSSGLALRWHVKSSDFPAAWLTAGAFGICDNNTCRYNTGDTLLWNAATTTGTSFLSNSYAYGVAGLFDLSLNLAGTPSGTHYVTVAITDPGSFYTKDITFIVSRNSTGVTNVSTTDDNIVLYPNPATNELNVVYGTNEVKSIAVYNIIGKVMSIYKVNGESANLNLENMPSGIYFVRLVNAHGDVVVTRKFTKQ